MPALCVPEMNMCELWCDRMDISGKEEK